jgi:hypothetical protein
LAFCCAVAADGARLVVITRQRKNLIMTVN